MIEENKQNDNFNEYTDILAKMWSNFPEMSFGKFIIMLNGRYQYLYGSQYFTENGLLFERYQQIVDELINASKQ